MARGSVYGEFRDNAFIAQSLKALLFSDNFTDTQKEAIDQISSKLSRLVCGDQDHADSWLDISNYAALVYKELNRKGRK
jgi:hypothetical protein